MDGFTLALICVVAVLVLAALVLKCMDCLLDRMFDYDDKFLCAVRAAERELAKRERLND